MRLIEQQVLETIARHAMFSPDQKVGVAVSGGADSVCLLHVMHAIASRWNLHLSVVHIDHGIRGAASRADAEFVRALADRFALPFYFRQADVPSMHDNLEQAARRVRLEFFRELTAAGQGDRVATGHTRSDQAETVLFRVLRGTGLTGLAGIRPVTEDGIVRPLLYSTREEVQAWLVERGIEWREDETNENVAFERNRIRRELMPLLRREFNPQVEEALANLAEIARQEARGTGDLGHLVVRQAIEAVKGDLRQVEFAHVEAILKLAGSEKGHGRIQIPGVEVTRSFDQIRFAPADDYEVPVDPPQTIGQIEFQVIEAEGASAETEVCDRLVNELDWEKVIGAAASAGRGVLRLRNWRPGDRYRRAGRIEEQKIKILFQEERIPLWERRGWPVLTVNGRIVWSRRFGPAAEVAPDQSTRHILRIRYTNSTDGVNRHREP